jgi:GNAT superfamily N-acetyltransferase
MAIKIRELQSADLPSIEDVLAGWFVNEDGTKDLENTAVQIKQISQFLGNKTASPEIFLGAIDENDKLVGLIGYTEEIYPKIKRFASTERIVQVSILMVSRLHTNQGIGTALLEWLERYALKNKLEEIILSSSSRWNDSWPFYLKNNYKDLGELENTHTRIFSKTVASPR